jgi:S-adenosylmethionine decarboxylase
MIVGTEWLIEAAGCNEGHLRDESLLRDLLERVIRDLGLKAVGSVWHKFPGEGGVTGLIALTESHLACHTYPEHRTATFNLYCCRTRPEWDWETNLKTMLGAEGVSVLKIERGNAASEISNFKSEISNLRSEINGLRSEDQNPKTETRNPQSAAAGGDVTFS